MAPVWQILASFVSLAVPLFAQVPDGSVMAWYGGGARWVGFSPGIGLTRTCSDGMCLWSADPAVLPHLGSDNVFSGSNRWGGATAWLPAPIQTLDPSATVTVGGSTLVPVSASVATAIRSTPTVTDGTDGQFVVLMNVGVAPVTFRDRESLAGSGLCLTGHADLALAPTQAVPLIWSAQNVCWIELSRPGVLAGASSLSAGSLTSTHGEGTLAATVGLTRSEVTPTSGGGAAFTKEFPAAICQASAGSLTLNSAGSTQPIADCAVGRNTYYGVARFPADAPAAVQGSFRLPSDVGAIALDLDWRTGIGNGSQGAVWRLQTSCAADDESDDPEWNSAQSVRSAAKSTPNRIIQAAIVSVTASGCGPGRRFFFQFSRTPEDPADDLQADAELIALRFTVQP